MKAEVTVLQGEREGETFKLLSNQRLVFGRDISCDVQLLDEGVSRKHFIIEGKGNSFMLVDQNSTNGTYINNSRVMTKILRSSDVIRSGDVHFSFKYVGTESDLTLGQVKFDSSDKLTTAISKKFDIKALGKNVVDPKSPAAKYFTALKVLYQVGDILHSENELTNLFNTIMDLTLKVVPADRAYLIMYNKYDDSYDPVVARRNDVENAQESEMKLSKTVLHKCISTGQAILSSDITRDDRFQDGQSVVLQDIHSVICVPVQTQAETFGAIYVDSVGSEGRKFFMEFDLELVAAIGRQAGVAIQRAQLFENLEDLFYGTIRALVATIEAKDKYTHGHSERVTEFALILGQEIGLSPKKLDNIRLASMLHDIGKIAVPERILHKPSRLSDAEFLLIKNHPVHGAEILKNIANIDEVIDGVLHHHEKWNGSGYPDGLAGEEIPLHARILTIADAFDAMTSSRPYRRNFTLQEVIDEFERCADDHFDGNLSRIFVKLVKEGKISPHSRRDVHDAQESQQQ